MRFQTKIIFVYLILVLALALLLGSLFYGLNWQQYAKLEENTLLNTSGQLVTQMNEKISQMSLTMEYILSDPTMLDDMHILARKNVADSYATGAASYIRKALYTEYVTSHFYRTIYFNQMGYVFTAESGEIRKSRSSANLNEIRYLKAADSSLYKPVLITAHQDNWGYDGNPTVYSLVKAVQGSNMGYIEVQNKVSSLINLEVTGDDITYYIYVNGNELLYASDGGERTALCEKILENGKKTSVYKVKAKNNTEYAAISHSQQYDISVIAFESTAVVDRMVLVTLPMVILITLILFLISMSYVILMSRYLTRPLQQMRNMMEHTQLENIGEQGDVQSYDDEIQALSSSYLDLMDRLQKSVVKEKRLAILQLQAQFDSLQAQVNPHFLFNVLNIISSRGMQDNDEQICEMCGCLAAMLRYSTNNIDRNARVAEELEYLQQYFYLLKARYEDRIAFEIRIEPEISRQILPKLTLQQIVENSINHGFQDSTDVMKLTITGWQDAERWNIRIHDNGQGFSTESLEELKDSMEKIREKILHQNSMEMEIGGMGLVNTYARCYLLYSDSLVFSLQNVGDGADVLISAFTDSKGNHNVGKGVE